MAGRPRGGSKLAALPSNERDGNETWSKETLEAMDARFTAAMTRAIATGKERVTLPSDPRAASAPSA